jgi:hypothetical protein
LPRRSRRRARSALVCPRLKAQRRRGEKNKSDEAEASPSGQSEIFFFYSWSRRCFKKKPDKS